MAGKEHKTWEFGDFQTPPDLAEMAVGNLRSVDESFSPKTIIEPTCGVGRFLISAANAYPNAERVIGLEIEPEYLEQLRSDISLRSDKDRFHLMQGDFFKTDWEALLKDAPKPVLVIGNPPWVTSADIGRLKGANLPEKSNFQKYKGFDAVTGKANFDISEWMMIQELAWLHDHAGAIAMLCKTAVARKLLRHAWKDGTVPINSRMVLIDAMKHFGAAVDACFFIMKTSSQKPTTDCEVYGAFDHEKPSQVFGYHDGMMLSDVPAFSRHHDLLGADPHYTWRSGVKHDCSKVMELKLMPEGLVNGFGEPVEVEDTYAFPLLKSSDLGNKRVQQARLKVLVTQRSVGDSTDPIQALAPNTWKYLQKHSALLDKRGSTIYRKKPRFSVFGIGPYAFTDWKVAISGFYKNLDFQVVGPIGEQPVMLDDTGYFLSARTQEEANFLCEMLNSKPAQTLLRSMVFWSDKRPITVDLLKRLHIGKLAANLDREKEYLSHVEAHETLPLFAKAEPAVTA